MSQDMREFARILRRHLARRHPNQSWWTRLLLRHMTWSTLVQMHQWEHDAWPELIGHDDDDFHGHSSPRA
jgi:hypothetical protein